ncbi:acyltransferase family protein [Saprospiraceae bacterium]|nr:acyltransferase family protein [Saprospiraceae bacterium]
MKEKKRKYYIDNLRILLTCLVVLHHLAITYGAPGLWYYNEGNSDLISSILMALFVATNQAFFMGMFFMISAYFLDKSWNRKSKKEVIKDKLKRLGIPLIFYALTISPLIIFLTTKFNEGKVMSILEFFKTENWLTFGPLWFIAALLIFTAIAITLRTKDRTIRASKSDIQTPNKSNILLFAISIGIISFVVRIWFPVGWSLKPFGFQLAHFPQYIALFYIGIIASKNDWFEQFTYQQGLNWMKLVSIFVFVLFPFVFYFGGAVENGTEPFMGGLGWQSFLFCIWEQIVGIGFIVGLIGIFKEKYNEQSDRLKSASASAYTVYIIHALLLVSISLLFKNIEIGSTIKFLILAPIALLICFTISNFIRKLPYFRKVL